MIGTKSKTECANHYIEVYIQSASWPLPNMDQQLTLERRKGGLVNCLDKNLALKYNRVIYFYLSQYNVILFVSLHPLPLLITKLLDSCLDDWNLIWNMIMNLNNL